MNSLAMVKALDDLDRARKNYDAARLDSPTRRRVLAFRVKWAESNIEEIKRAELNRS